MAAANAWSAEGAQLSSKSGRPQPSRGPAARQRAAERHPDFITTFRSVTQKWAGLGLWRPGSPSAVICGRGGHDDTRVYGLLTKRGASLRFELNW